MVQKPAIVPVPMWDVSTDLLDGLVVPLSAAFGRLCRIAAPISVSPAAFDRRRGQYAGHGILAALGRLDFPGAERVLGIIDADCYVPGLNFIEGLIEICLGLFLGKSIGNLLATFPMPLVGAMMLLVGIELGRAVLKLKGWRLRTALFTAALSIVTNMAVGFGAGLAVAYLVRELRRRELLPCACVKS